MSAGRCPGFSWRMILVAALVAGPAAALAAPLPSAEGISVRHAWVRWLPAGLPAAGYFTLVNSSPSDRFLTGVSSPDYASAMLHQSYSLPDGTEGMRPVGRLRIPARGEAVLAPGGYHVMLMNPSHPIAAGDRVTLELRLDNGTGLRVVMPVQPPGFAP